MLGKGRFELERGLMNRGLASTGEKITIPINDTVIIILILY